MNPLRLLEVIKDARDEGRTRDAAMLIDELGADVQYVRCTWASTLVREPDWPRMRRVNAEMYLAGVAAHIAVFAEPLQTIVVFGQSNGRRVSLDYRFTVGDDSTCLEGLESLP